VLNSKVVGARPERPKKLVCLRCYVAWVCKHNYAPEMKPPVLDRPDGTWGTCPECGSADLRLLESFGEAYAE
jgi:ribosomal protein L40E